MSGDLDLTELEWSDGQPDTSPPSSSESPDTGGRAGWGSTEVVLVGGSVVALLVVTYLVYADGASGGGEAADREQDGQGPDVARDAHSAENEPWESAGTFETRESGEGLVQR